MMKTKLLTLLLPALLVAACSSNDHDDADIANAAVVATRAPDYGSGAISVVDLESPYTAVNNQNESSTSDIVVRADGDHYFVLKRYGANQILRYDAATPTTPTWTYSTNSVVGEESNPADLIVASPTKAYLLRYGSGTLWIVNPSATREANFKIGEIDLSPYDSDGVPDMSAGLIKDGKLYVAMQRLEFYDAVKDGYIAVIDTATDTEITTATRESGLKGIDLPAFNPVGLAAVPGTSKILVSAAGSYGSYPDYVPPYNGGIVSIDTGNNTATLIVDDGDAGRHPYGVLDALAVVDEHRAYFVGVSGYTDNGQSLFRFDPTATTVTPAAVSGFTGKDLGALAVDPNGLLWIGRTSDSAPGLTVLDYANGAEMVKKDLIDTVLTPINIDFMRVQ
jgi:hypothetical protein